PTRAAVMKAFRNWNEANPFLLPGNLQTTGPTNQVPVRGQLIVKYTDGTFQPVSQLKIPK
ncbi:MAG TPA: hypothetical protein VJK66_03165, partial [Gaiellaceae bacterium]|nr:hypothetical protein [Gaiellaceae bacterium]